MRCTRRQRRDCLVLGERLAMPQSRVSYGVRLLITVFLSPKAEQ